MTKGQFKDWYAGTLECLYRQPAAGFPAMIISLALLERYARGKSGTSDLDGFGNACKTEVLGLFKGLNDLETVTSFWQAYRHGLMHQVTFTRMNRKGRAFPGCWLTYEISKPIEIRDGSFYVNPIRFSKVVVRAILKDYASFAAVHNPHTRTPTLNSSKSATGCESVAPILPEDLHSLKGYYSPPDTTRTP